MPLGARSQAGTQAALQRTKEGRFDWCPIVSVPCPHHGTTQAYNAHSQLYEGVPTTPLVLTLTVTLCRRRRWKQDYANCDRGQAPSDPLPCSRNGAWPLPCTHAHPRIRADDKAAW